MMTRTLTILLLLPILVAGLAAQEPHRGRREVRRLIEERLQGLDPAERERLMREWLEIVGDMPREERLRFMGLEPEAKQEFVNQAIAARRQAAEEAILGSLTAEERAAYEALPLVEQKRRLVEIRVDLKLERYLTEAVSRQLRTAEQAAALRNGSVADRMTTVLVLQKDLFLAIHRETFESMPPPDRDRLLAADPREFFEDPLVRDLRALDLFDPDALQGLRARGPDAVRDLLESIEDGSLAQRPAFFRPGGLERYGAMDERERRHYGRELRRTRFYRDLLGGEDRPPGFGPVVPPPEIMERLSDQERRIFRGLPDIRRRVFLEKRFPELADAPWMQAPRGDVPPLGPGNGPRREGPPGRRGGEGGGPPDGQPRGGPGILEGLLLGDLLDRLERLPEEERRRLRGLPLSEVILALGLERGRRQAATPWLPPDLVPVYESLDPVQREVLMSLPESADRIAFLRSLLELR